MSEVTLARPTSPDREAWKNYWITQKTLWRLEPEISAERQAFLTERRNIQRDLARNIYPFLGVALTRADVEWLLVTHDNGRGPVDWDDPTQRHRRGIDLHGADLRGVNLRYLPLSGAILGLTREEWWHAENIVEPETYGTHLEGADLQLARLEGVALRFAHLEKANLLFANLRAAELRSATLAGANLERAVFDHASALVNITLADAKHGCAQLADITWGETNMALLDWTHVTIIGEETAARALEAAARRKQAGVKRRDITEKYQVAVRGYRQLAAQLRSQGLNELSDGFAYRALVIQRNVLRLQRRRMELLGSRILDVLAGYGFRPVRSFLAYLLFIFTFAGLYDYAAIKLGIPFSFEDALIFSITSFHGRGFTPVENIALSNPLTLLAAAEAMIGLIIEITFIATFTQRYFGRQ